MHWALAARHLQMPSLRFRRVDQAQRGNVVSERFSASSRSSSSGFSREASTGSTGSTGSVVAFCAGRNVLDRGQDGALRPGRLLSAPGGPNRGALIVDASASVSAAPSSVRLEVFVPQWRANLKARERYSRPLPARYADGSLLSRPKPKQHSHADSLERAHDGHRLVLR